jgi:hypothetical protein
MARLSYVVLFALVFACEIAFAQVSNIDGLYANNIQSPTNYVVNKGCNKNLRSITASGGSLTRNTTTPLENGADCAIDASASGQTYTFATYTIDRALSGGNCEARFVYKGDASLYKAYVNVNSVKVTTDLQLVSSTATARTVSMNFPCGTQPLTTAVVIESTSASAALINVAGVYAGFATNISNIPAGSSTVVVGKIPATASCQWSGSSASRADFAVDTDCPAPTFTVNEAGCLTTDTDLPQFTCNNILPGKFTVNVSVPFFGNVAAARPMFVSDGTTFCYVASNDTANSVAGVFGSCTFVYTSPGARTFKIQYSTNTGNAQIQNNGNTEFTFNAVYSPDASQQAIRADQTNYGWTDGGTITITNGTKGTTSLDKIRFKRSGENLDVRYEYRQTTAGSGAGPYLIQIPTASGCVIDTAKIGSSTAAYADGVQMSVVGTAAISNSTGAASNGAVVVHNTTNVKVFLSGNTAATATASFWPIGAANTLGATTLSASGSFSVPCVGWIENQSAFQLAGSVNSLYGGSVNTVDFQFGGATSFSNCTGTCTIYNSLTPGIAVVRNVASQYTITFPTGLFSGPPVCTYGGTNAGVRVSTCTQWSVANTSTTAVLRCQDAVGDQDSFVSVSCKGPR